MPERRQCTVVCLLTKQHWTCSEPFLDASTIQVLSVPNRTGYWLSPSVSVVMAQLRCLTVTEEGELLKLERVKLRGSCVLLRKQILTQAESEQMQLTVSLFCIWCAGSSSLIH